MPYRWRCCKCDNGWMTVQAEQNICTWSECQHVKCNGCDQRNMAARGDITTGGCGGRGIGGFFGGGGPFISASHTEIPSDEDDQGARFPERGGNAALDYSVIPINEEDEEGDD